MPGGSARTRFDINAPGRLPLQTLLLRRETASSLVVYLHGSVERHHYELPRFERLDSLKDLEAHVLFLADPTLALSPNLRIGWFIGSESDDATEHLSAVVRTIAEQLRVNRVIIAGASAGGFGAIAMAPRVPNALAIAFSPQTNVGRFGKEWADALRRAAFSNYGDYAAIEHDPTQRARVDLSTLYADGHGAAVWYVQNTGDTVHVAEQERPFADSVDDRVVFIDEFHCAGHNPPTRTRVLAWIERALEHPERDPREFALSA